MQRALVFALAVTLSLGGAFVVGKELGRRGRSPADAYRMQREAALTAARTLDAPSFEGVGVEGGAEQKPETAPGKGVFVRVAERLKPSVVTIQVPLLKGGVSSGTGIIVTRDGAILTNHHVVEGGEEPRVELSSHDVYAAKIVGDDPWTDLALLKIDVPSELLPAVFGDSDELAVGEEVLAVGNALDFGWTVTSGIVSSLHRSNLVTGKQGQYTDYIQTDAAINPGNSGGPLANLKGEVIGINVAVLANRADGIGFAIPANDAKFVAEELISHGRVVRGYLGMNGSPTEKSSFRDLTNAERRALGSGITGGARVASVVRASPAEAAGFRVGDFIYALDGRAIEDYEELRNRVARLAPGSIVEASVRRGGADQKIRATVGVRPDLR